MDSTRLEAVLEELATSVVMADLEPVTLHGLEEQVCVLCRALEAAHLDDLAAEANGVQEALRSAVTSDVGAQEAALDALTGLIEKVQHHVRHHGVNAEPREAPVSGAAELVTRDAETLELLHAFMDDTKEGMTQADEILVKGERAGFDRESINTLFRLFHSIKGLSGHLPDIKDMVALSHETESVLDHVRSGRLVLEGKVLDAVLEATALARTLMDNVQVAVRDGTAVASAAGQAEVMERLRAVCAGLAGEEEITTSQIVVPPSAGVLNGPHGSAPEEEPHAETEAANAEELPDRESPVPGAAGKHELLRVDAERVDALVEMVGELLIVQSMVIHAPEVVGLAAPHVQKQLGQLHRIGKDLQDAAMRMRMVAIHGVFRRMVRVVRELAHKAGKDVVLTCSGETTEIDRAMVDQLEQPLVHLIRNAIDHGVESPEERLGQSKPRTATIRLSAYHQGGSFVVEVADDGRGLMRDRILQRAREQGLVQPDEQLSVHEIDALIFAPGFSTADRVTEISGRGVGMDVVKRNLESMRGRVMVQSAPGHGTTFRLVLPLTLAIIDGMVVACGAERYIIPTLSVVETLRVLPDMVSVQPGGMQILNVRGSIIPLVRLSHLVQQGVNGRGERPVAVLVESLGQRLALEVDQVVTQQQVVIKPLDKGVQHADCFSGAAILSDGRVSLIFNIDRVCASGNQRQTREKKGRETCL